MRSDMRTAKDTAMDLKHVAHDINKSKKSSEAEISSARNMMDATVKAMEALKVTARDYDRENKQRMGVKGTVDAASDKPKQSEGGFFNKDEDEQRGGMLGGGKNEEHHKGVLGGTKDDNGGVMGSSETVETIVRKILRDHFNLRPLDHQIKAAEKSLTPSLMERAKEKMHDVKEKITGDKSEPTHDSHGHHYEGHHHVGHQEQAAVP
ncbi:TOM1 protein 2 [Phytophthora nicotianae]|uniref:TOM1 protein 2 n=1 Tax=Phytophthora nicotianae TaxID=4792 RepID=A0A0W8CZQ0_PHYNI|nr:TOM1 protein 2 [Phytophthora nicotianae]